MKKRILLAILVACLLASCTVANTNNVSDIGENSGVEYITDISEVFGYPGYWEPDPEITSYPDVNRGKEPEYVLTLDGEIKSGDTSFLSILTEQNGKNFVSYSNTYLLEKKNDSGEWEMVPFSKEHVFQDSYFVGTSKEEGTTSLRLTVNAEYHGLECFESGEYRLTRKATCMVGDEERGTAVSLEFTIK